MSDQETALQAKAGPSTIGEYARDVFDKDPKTALELVLAENERIRMESRSLAEVTMTRNGLVAANMAGLYRLGQMYSSSKLVPDAYQGKPADCAIVCQLAMAWGINPFMAFQKVYIVHGKPGVEAQRA